jgi:hypothetical protein
MYNVKVREQLQKSPCKSTILDFAAFWWSGEETLLTVTCKTKSDISEEEILKGHEIMT